MHRWLLKKKKKQLCHQKQQTAVTVPDNYHVRNLQQTPEQRSWGTVMQNVHKVLKVVAVAWYLMYINLWPWLSREVIMTQWFQTVC